MTDEKNEQEKSWVQQTGKLRTYEQSGIRKPENIVAVQKLVSDLGAINAVCPNLNSELLKEEIMEGYNNNRKFDKKTLTKGSDALSIQRHTFLSMALHDGVSIQGKGTPQEKTFSGADLLNMVDSVQGKLIQYHREGLVTGRGDAKKNFAEQQAGLKKE